MRGNLPRIDAAKYEEKFLRWTMCPLGGGGGEGRAQFIVGRRDGATWAPGGR